MAFTKAPTQDTYSSVRIPAFHNLDIRSGSSGQTYVYRRNAGTVNVLPIGKKGEDIYAQLRLPMVGAEVAVTGYMRGVFVWSYEYNGSNRVVYYAAVNDQVYWSTNGRDWNSIITWTFVDDPYSSVGFCEYIDDTGAKSLIIVDGNEGYVLPASAIPGPKTKITDADFPTPHTPHPVFIDGYLFLAKEGTGDIYNSNLNDPTAWTAGNFISSEVYPDKIQAIVKMNNYLLAIGSTGCEYFYDAGNATGSPLARYEGATLPFGCMNIQTIATNKNRVVFLANMNDGEIALVVVEDFKYQNITPPWLVSFLSGIGGAIFSTYGFFIRQYGQLLYCISSTDGVYGTFFYCFDNEMWGELEYSGGIRYTTFAGLDEPLTFFGAESLGSSTHAVFGAMASNNVSTFVAGTGAWTYLNQDSVRLLGGTIASMSFTGIIRLPTLDFGTNNIKTMSRMSFNIETTISGGSSSLTPPTITVTHFNDDRQTIYATQTLLYTDENTFLTQQGAFRRRRINVEVAPSESTCRVLWFEFDINKGQQ